MRALCFPHTAKLFPPLFSRRIGMLPNIMHLRDSVFVNTLGIFMATWIILSGSFSHEKSGVFGNGKLYGKLDASPAPRRRRKRCPLPLSWAGESLEGIPAFEDLCFVRRAPRCKGARASPARLGSVSALPLAPPRRLSVGALLAARSQLLPGRHPQLLPCASPF